MRYNWIGLMLASAIQPNDSICVVYILRIDHHKKSSKHPSPYIAVELFLLMRTLKVYNHSNFQICSIVLLAIVAVLYITSQGVLTGSQYDWRFIHFGPLHPFHPPPIPPSGNHQSVFCMYKPVCFVIPPMSEMLTSEYCQEALAWGLCSLPASSIVNIRTIVLCYCVYCWWERHYENMSLSLRT